MTEYMGEVWQDGEKVAATYGTQYAQVTSETTHYAAQYSQDGPVMVRLFEKRGKRWMLVGKTDD